ncbi:excitatory amino acid transporter 3-like [Ptychodera flava]|uniref:excitatory amino acid transporter 3-like n=1 Tax=Ptychodera flava TaxID=63121 RepID=UPI00396A3185
MNRQNGQARSSDLDLSAIAMEENTGTHRTCWQRFRAWVTADKILVTLLLFSVLLGFLLGFTIGNQVDLTDEEIDYIRFPGDLFMGMLKMMVIPPITSSLVASLASLDKKVSGKLGLYAVIYYLCTTVTAVIIGIIMVMAIQPGNHGKKDDGPAEESDDDDPQAPIQYAMMDLIRNCFPENIVAACFRTYVTDAVWVDVETFNSTTNTTNTTQTIDYVASWSDSMNILGLVVFSIALGIVLGAMGEDGEPLAKFFTCLNEATMRLVMIIMWYAPIGIFFLILGVCFSVADRWAEVMAQIGMYFATVCAGLAVHGVVVLPLLYLVIVRKNPFIYLKGVFEALITALGTASSSATLPLTTKNLEENNGVDKRVTRFVLPIGATINMDGTALYEAVAAIFIAQYRDIPLDAGAVITISITATIASIGAAGIPQAGLVTMVIVFTAVGLPLEDISLILSVDIILDRIRTMINVEGDSIGAGIVDKLARKHLDQHSQEDALEMTPEPYTQPDVNQKPPSYDAMDKKPGHQGNANKPTSSWENAGYDHESVSTPL